MVRTSLEYGINEKSIKAVEDKYNSEYWFNMNKDFEQIISLFIIDAGPECFNIDCVHCENQDWNNCIISRIFLDIIKYQEKYPKIVYSVMSSSLNSLEDISRLMFTNRISKCIEVLEKLDKQSVKENKMKAKYRKVQEFLIKVLDHYELICYQNLNSQDYDAIDKLINDRAEEIENKMKDLERENTERVDKKNDNLQSQLISLISIFVTISFVIFGGMNLLNGLFGNPTSSVFQTLMLGSVFGLVMITSIFVFMKFIIFISFRKEEQDRISDLIEKDASFIKYFKLSLFSLMTILLLSFFVYIKLHY